MNDFSPGKGRGPLMDEKASDRSTNTSTRFDGRIKIPFLSASLFLVIS